MKYRQGVMGEQMVGDLRIRLGNGVELLGDVNVYFDPAGIGHNGLHCLSHAHFDHLPSKVMGDELVCSPITLRCARERLGKDIRIREFPQIRVLDSGHIYGSTMFLVEGEKRVLYTGDLCTRDRQGLMGARPEKVDVLIIESTYGLPRYVFPPQEEVEGELRDWVEDKIASGCSVGIFAYPLGKTQELLRLFRDLDPYLHGSSMQITQLLEAEGMEFSYRQFEPLEAKPPFLLICPTGVRRAGFIERFKKAGMYSLAVSGWAIESSFKHRMGVDEAFPLSDHADFNELLSFTERCEPSLVLTHHGFERELASRIKSNLGLDARALMRDQRSLLEF